MKNFTKLNKTLIATSLTAIMGSSFAATTDSDSINLIGSIAKAVSISFDNATLDLGDMSDTSVANFTVVANTDYTISGPATGKLVNVDNGAELDFGVSVDKTNSTMSVTPAAISATQAAGNYQANVTLDRFSSIINGVFSPSILLWCLKYLVAYLLYAPRIFYFHAS
jgi:hypothetical protein